VLGRVCFVQSATILGQWYQAFRKPEIANAGWCSYPFGLCAVASLSYSLRPCKDAGFSASVLCFYHIFQAHLLGLRFLDLGIWARLNSLVKDGLFGPQITRKSAGY